MWAATGKAEAELGWDPKFGLAEMCRDQWAWATKYPRGFEAEEGSEAERFEAEGDGSVVLAAAVAGGKLAAVGAQRAAPGVELQLGRPAV